MVKGEKFLKNEIIIFEDTDIKLEVKLQDETVWLTQNQMAELFQTTRNNVTIHIRNCYEEKELSEMSTSKDFLLVQNEGSREIKRKIKHYNLDVIISVGYRVKSKRGTQFRIWSNKILKDYLLNGKAINQKRIEYLEKTKTVKITVNN